MIYRCALCTILLDVKVTPCSRYIVNGMLNIKAVYSSVGPGSELYRILFTLFHVYLLYFSRSILRGGGRAPRAFVPF